MCVCVRVSVFCSFAQGHRDCEYENETKSSIKLIGEKSATYLRSSEAAKRLFDMSSSLVSPLRVIFLLRNPVDRVYRFVKSIFFYSGLYLHGVNNTMVVLGGWTFVRTDLMEHLKSFLNSLELMARSRFHSARSNICQRIMEFISLLHDSSRILQAKFRAGEYIRHIKRWTRVFPRDQLLFLTSEGMCF